MTPTLDNTLLVPQGDYSPVVRDRINRLIREADRLFSLMNVRKQCQRALIDFFDDKQPSSFADWGAQLSENKEFRFALNLSLSYKSTMDEIVQWANGCIDDYLFAEIQEARAGCIEELARIKFASRWYQMKDDDVAWRVFSKNIPYGEAGKEEEIKQFFEILDKICILTDLLLGHAYEYGLEIDYSQTKLQHDETFEITNQIFKKNHNGKCIDFHALHKLLGESFVDEIKYGYEWLAPWRMLYDLSLLEDTTLTAFAEQMNKWYPHAKKPCSADSMGDYCNPYLGSTAFVLWDENEFKKHKTSKQSINGYRKLYNDCEAIKEALKSFFKQ